MSTATIATILLLGVFLVLVFLRVPVVYAIGVASLLDFFYLGINPMQMALKFVSNLNSYTLLAVPFFILMGELMSAGGITDTLIAFSKELVGWMHGGAAMVNVVASFFFGGISGSSSADCASLGPIEIKMMEEQGYDREFSTCLTMASSVEGILVPPSQNMVIFTLAAAGVTTVSIGQLFMGGLIPGILLGVALMIITAIIARKRNYPKGRVMSLKEIWKATKDALLGLMTCIIIVGGVILGWFTATESAAVAVVYAFIVTFFVYREIPLRQFGDILRKSLRTIAMVMALISTASMFGWLLAYLKVPTMVTNLLLGVSDNKVVILLLINVMCLILGCIMDMGPLILILTPILLPVATQLGMAPIQFGAMLILNLAIGLCTPPVGAALFAGCSIGRIKIEDATKACLPFYAMMILVLMLVTFWQPLSMFVPQLMMK